jgi:hypothetical protein
MTYHIEAEKVNLDELRNRIETTDLVPSRRSLLEDIGDKIQILQQHDIVSLADLRKALKNAKRLQSLSEVTGIDKAYLVLLRREIESYFPKPIKLLQFDWLSQEEIAKLEEYGIRHTAAFYNAVKEFTSLDDMADSTGVDTMILEQLIQYSDLTRMQWVSATAARMLEEAGYNCVSKVAGADPDELCEALRHVNEENRFFKGNIGLRDIKRLIKSASYVV